jgi:putative FmdB family regulatory protein
MPTYDYVCDSCQHEFEEFESIKADPQTVCPECTQPKLRRKIGAGAAIIFKGSGFYQTDYRSESYKQRAKADQPGGSSSTSTSTTTSTTTSTSTSTSGSTSTPAPSKSESSKTGTNGNGTA